MASAFYFRIQIRIWLALCVWLPETSFAGDQNIDAQAVAQRFANEFAIAQAGGADLSRIRGVRTAIEQLSRGIPGGGQHSSLIFRVGEVPKALAERAAEYLAFDRNILRYRPPVHYTVAWTSGRMESTRTQPGASLSRLLAERAAQSYTRVFSAARAAAAPVQQANDVASAMRLIEDGIHGSGAHSGTRFQASPVRENVRYMATKLLRFEEGSLHFIKDADRKSGDEVKAAIAQGRPAQLAQQVVALYETARSIGVGFEDAHTPADIVDILRTGVRTKNQLGTQFFRLPAISTEEEWRRCVAYLRLNNSTLRYAPP